ncbi:MAG: hypothetical protein IPH37_06510 [Burkholderiales bacterium]|nr:hypothetical protein [Burkholderiales bacterium]
MNAIWATNLLQSKATDPEHHATLAKIERAGQHRSLSGQRGAGLPRSRSRGVVLGGEHFHLPTLLARRCWPW